MPRVPELTPQVSSRGLPYAYQTASGATPDAFGAAQGRALASSGQQLQAAGNDLAQLSIQMMEEDNEREAKRADNELTRALRQITVGDGETPGYYGLSGQAAVDAYGDTEKSVQEARRKIAATLQNPRARELFESAAFAREERALDGLARHVVKERKVANDAVTEVRLNEAADDAGASWNDPKVIGQSVAIVRSEVQAMADRNGWAPEVTASKMEAAETAVHQQVIDSALQSDPAYAQEYYNKNKASIDGSARTAIEKALETGVLRQQSQSEADRIMGMGLDERAALTEARKISDAKLRDEVVTRVKARYDEESGFKAAADKALSDSAWGVVNAGGDPDDLPPSMLAALGSEVNSMWSFVAARKKRAQGEVTTDWDAYGDYMSMNVDELRNVSLERAKAHLAEDEFNQVRDRVRDALQGKMDESDPFTPEQMFSARAAEIGLANDKDNREEYGRALSMYQQEIAKAERANGDRDLSNDEMRDILHKITDPIAIKKNWWFGTREAQPFDTEVPDEDRQQIIEAHQLRGLPPPTELEIVRLYLRSREPE